MRTSVVQGPEVQGSNSATQEKNLLVDLTNIFAEIFAFVPIRKTASLYTNWPLHFLEFFYNK